jgi:Tfp pilus assembly protein PilF
MLIVLLLAGCSNNKVKESYKQKQYSTIKGMNAAQEGKYNKAIEEYLRAYEYDKKDVFVLKELALTYGKLGDVENSERFYKKVLELEPRESKSIYNLAVLFYGQERYSESMEILEGVPLESITVDIKKLKGFIYFQNKDYQKAYEELIQIKESMYKDIEYAKVYGEVLLKLGKISELHPYITELYSENKNNYEVVYLYGRHLSEILSRQEEAANAYDDYIIEYGPNKYILIERARLAYIQADYNEARKYMNLVPESSQYDEDVLKMEYKIYEKLGDKAKVVELKELLSRIEKD